MRRFRLSDTRAGHLAEEPVAPAQHPDTGDSLARSALSGVAWNYSGAAVLIATQIVSTAATARLIAPAQFGAYAVSQAAAGIFGYFTLSALGAGLLRRQVLGPRTVGTAFVLSVASGGVVALTMCLVAGVWSGAWNVPASSLVRVSAIALFFVSMSTVPLAMLRRQLRFRSAAAVETAAQVIGVTVGVLLAIQLNSAMALVIGQTVAAGGLVAASAWLARRELHFCFDMVEARELFSFAGHVSALNIGFYTLYTAPSWVIGRGFGAHSLGVYSRANLIVGLPLNYLTTGIAKVVYPLYGRMGTAVARRRTLISEATIVTTGFVWPPIALVAGAAPVVVSVLLGPGWGGSSDVLRLCALIACANLPWVLLANAAEAFGWMQLVWRWQSVYLVVLALGSALVYMDGLSLNGLLGAVAAAQWLGYGTAACTFVRRHVLDGRMVAVAQLVHGIAAGAVFSCSALCAYLLRDVGVGWQVAGQVVVTLGCFGALFTARRRFPASRILRRRLTQAMPGRRILGLTWS